MKKQLDTSSNAAMLIDLQLFETIHNAFILHQQHGLTLAHSPTSTTLFTEQSLSCRSPLSLDYISLDYNYSFLADNAQHSMQKKLKRSQH